MEKLIVKLWKLWYSLQYRLCMVDAYLADNRGDHLARAEWLTKAMEYQREYVMCGRRLV
jgi:hypothetical protein